MPMCVPCSAIISNTGFLGLLKIILPLTDCVGACMLSDKIVVVGLHLHECTHMHNNAINNLDLLLVTSLHCY